MGEGRETYSGLGFINFSRSLIHPELGVYQTQEYNFVQGLSFLIVVDAGG